MAAQPGAGRGSAAVRGFVTALVAVLLLAAVPPSAIAAVGTAAIAGTVTDDGGVGIANVEVHVHAPALPATNASATTAADGTYEIRGLVPDSYVVAFGTAEHGLNYVAEVYDNAPTQSAATMVELAEGQTATGVDAELAHGASISGTVTDEPGAPVAGLHVVAFTAGLPAFHASTDAAGHYTVNGLPAGSYTVRFSASSTFTYVEEYWDDSHDWHQVTPVPLAAAEARTGIDAVLTRAAAVSGTVLTAFGHLMAESSVCFAPVTDGPAYSVFSGTTFALGGILPGSYRVFALEPGGSCGQANAHPEAPVVTLERGQQLSGLVVRQTWSGGLRGVVTDATARPLAGVHVTAVNMRESGEREAVTGPDGAYELSAPPGSYNVEFRSDSTGPVFAMSYYPGTVELTGARPVTVPPDGWVADIDVALIAYGAIAGSVTGPTGAPVPGVRVTAETAATVTQAVTAADGSYRIDVLPGSYLVGFSPPSGTGLWAQFYGGGPSSPAAQAVAVRDGATTRGVDARLARRERFPDVVPGQAFFQDITWLADEGITGGYPDMTFRPTTPVSREAMAAFLFRLARDRNKDGHAPSAFVDVVAGSPFRGEIEWLSGERIATGWPDGTFRPGASIERQAMAAFLYRFEGSPAFIPPAVSPFVDVRPGDPFYAEICWLASEGISTGTVTPSGAYFKPAEPIDRQAMAAFLHRIATRASRTA